MSFTAQPIPIHRIYLDNENARHDPIDSEPEIIEYLLTTELVRPLAKDIADRGLSPIDRMAVIPHPRSRGDFIAVEGNRRMCAIKLLNDPNRAASDSDRQYFRTLVKSMTTPPTTLEAVVFPDRNTARPWIQLRHEGAQGGIGMRTWDTTQKDRHHRGGETVDSTPNSQAVLLLDYAVSRGLISDTERDEISVTTLTRFLSNPLVRDALGLSSARSLSISVPQTEFDKAVTRFLKDAHGGEKGGGGVHSRTKKEDRENYAHRLRKQGVAPSTRLNKMQHLNAATGIAQGKRGKPIVEAKQERHNRNPDKRPNVIPQDFRIKISDKVLKRLFDELRAIDAQQFSFAAVSLFRGIIERSAKLYCKQHGLGHDDDLHVLIERVAARLQKDGIDATTVKPFRVMASNRDIGFSPETLGAFVHGGLIPTRVELNRYWDALEGCIRLVLERLKK